MSKVCLGCKENKSLCEYYGKTIKKIRKEFEKFK